MSLSEAAALDDRSLPSPAPASPPWYSCDGTPFEGDEPFFYAPSDFPWAARVEAAWPEIRAELEALLAAEGLSFEPYFDAELVSGPERWKTFGFFFWGLKSARHCRLCPRITALLESIPDLTTASLNLLEPESEILPHSGDTNAIVRCHLGLVVPAPLPDCGLQVGSESRSWEQGRLLMFCDAHTHRAWNRTKQRRFVFFFDVLRPEYASSRLEICARVLAALELRKQGQRHPWLLTLPAALQRLLLAGLQVAFRVAIPLQRRFVEGRGG